MSPSSQRPPPRPHPGFKGLISKTEQGVPKPQHVMSNLFIFVIVVNALILKITSGILVYSVGCSNKLSFELLLSQILWTKDSQTPLPWPGSPPGETPPKWWDLKMLGHEFFPAKVSLRPFVSLLKIESLSPPSSLARYQIILGSPKLVHRACRLTSVRRGRMRGLL